jgi:hypothetical protein
MEPSAQGYIGPYPDLNMVAFDLVHDIEVFSNRFGITSQQRPRHGDGIVACTIVIQFFDAVREALRALQGRVILEFVCGDLIKELTKMRLGDDISRPAQFPTLYMRGYLSNVPYVKLLKIHSG